MYILEKKNGHRNAPDKHHLYMGVFTSDDTNVGINTFYTNVKFRLHQVFADDY